MKYASDGFLQWHLHLSLQLLLSLDRQVPLHFLRSDSLFKLSLLVVDEESVVYHDCQCLLHILRSLFSAFAVLRHALRASERPECVFVKTHKQSCMHRH